MAVSGAGMEPRFSKQLRKTKEHCCSAVRCPLLQPASCMLQCAEDCCYFSARLDNLCCGHTNAGVYAV
eukprot:1157490-Pelagomonas_calceolata.AAC.8